MPPRPPRRRRSSAGLPWRAAVLLLALLPAAAPAQSTTPSEDDFGRWQRPTEGCRLSLQEATAQQSLSCRSLRLDQQLAGLLSIRFLAQGSATTAQLVFAGVLQAGSRPMRCREGSCTPQLPLQLQVSAVASGGVGGSLALPQARLAKGSCRLERRQVSCEASDGEGGRWQADTRW